jgi:hypothetical protein
MGSAHLLPLPKKHTAFGAESENERIRQASPHLDLLFDDSNDLHLLFSFSSFSDDVVEFF